MPGKTLSDRVDDLEKGTAEIDKVVAVQTNRLDNLEDTSQSSREEQRLMAVRFDTYQRESEREVALLKQQVTQTKADLEKWGGRVWALAAALIVTFIGLVGTSILAISGLKK